MGLTADAGRSFGGNRGRSPIREEIEEHARALLETVAFTSEVGDPQPGRSDPAATWSDNHPGS